MGGVGILVHIWSVAVGSAHQNQSRGPEEREVDREETGPLSKDFSRGKSSEGRRTLSQLGFRPWCSPVPPTRTLDVECPTH